MEENIVSKWEQEIKQRTADSKAALVGLSPQFKAAGIAYVVAFYDGEGDSGSINSIQFCGPDENRDDVYAARREGDLEGTLKCPTLHDPQDESKEIQVDNPGKSLESFFDDMCPCGYENNEGGFGAIIFDVEAGKVRVNHAWRTTDYTTEDFDA